jgi:hypothetical protein
MCARIRIKQGMRSYRSNGGASSTRSSTERLQRLKVETNLALSWEGQYLARLVAKNPWTYLVGEHGLGRLTRTTTDCNAVIFHRMPASNSGPTAAARFGRGLVQKIRQKISRWA